MFQQFIPNQRGSGYSKYENEIAVAVNKSGITIIGKANLHLSGSGYVAVFSNNTEWALKPVSEKEGGYKLSTWGEKDGSRNNKWHVVCQAFIKSAKLTVGSVYIGKLQGGMVVFSKIPTELLGSG